MVPGIGVECVCLSGAMLARAGVGRVHPTAFTIYPFPTTHVSNTRVEGGGGIWNLQSKKRYLDTAMHGEKKKRYPIAFGC